ncbi:MAG: hypothetical protein KJ692_11465 [Verrucomicrobia bacterium]|nr:hypothetical protein [Verrucomicrobiota bacterium]
MRLISVCFLAVCWVVAALGEQLPIITLDIVRLKAVTLDAIKNKHPDLNLGTLQYMGTRVIASTTDVIVMDTTYLLADTGTITYEVEEQGAITNASKPTTVIVKTDVNGHVTDISKGSSVNDWLAAVYLHGIPCASEAEEAGDVVQCVVTNYHFAEKSKSMPEKPPIFCRPGGTGISGQTPHVIIVYSVTDKDEQDKIVDLIAAYRARRQLRHIVVYFYKEENWTTRVSKDGSRGGGRGEEQLIRTLRL